jgi:hypothetical protein
MNGERILKQLTKGVYLLDSNRILNTNTNTIYTPDYSWLVEDDNISVTIGNNIIPLARSFNDILSKEKDTRMVIFVYCHKIVSVKKMRKAELHDQYRQILYPIEGSQNISDTWIEFNLNIKPENAYLLLIRSDNNFPSGFEIINHKPIK